MKIARRRVNNVAEIDIKSKGPVARRVFFTIRFSLASGLRDFDLLRRLAAEQRIELAGLVDIRRDHPTQFEPDAERTVPADAPEGIADAAEIGVHATCDSSPEHACLTA